MAASQQRHPDISAPVSAFRNAPGRDRRPITPASSMDEESSFNYNNSPVVMQTRSRPPPPSYPGRPTTITTVQQQSVVNRTYRIPNAYDERRILCCTRRICCLIIALLVILLVLCAIIAVILVLALKERTIVTETPVVIDHPSTATASSFASSAMTLSTVVTALASSPSTSTTTVPMTTTTVPTAGNVTDTSTVVFTNPNLSAITSLQMDEQRPGLHLSTDYNYTTLYALNVLNPNDIVIRPMYLQIAKNSNCTTCRIYAVTEVCFNDSGSCTDANMAYCCTGCTDTNDVCVAYGSSLQLSDSHHCGVRMFSTDQLQYCAKSTLADGSCILNSYFYNSTSFLQVPFQSCNFLPYVISPDSGFNYLVAATSAFNAPLQWSATIVVTAEQPMLLVSNFAMSLQIPLDNTVIYERLELYAESVSNAVVLCVGNVISILNVTIVDTTVKYGFGSPFVYVDPNEVVQLTSGSGFLIWNAGDTGLNMTLFNVQWLL